MDDVDFDEWAARIWDSSLYTKLDADYRQLANNLIEMIQDSPEDAAHIMAVLVMRDNML